MYLLLSMAAKALAVGFFLWLAGATTHVKIGLKAAVVCALIASLVAMVPFVGWLLSVWVLFSLLQYYTRAEVVPDLVMLVLLAQLFAMAAGALVPGNPADSVAERIQLQERCMEEGSQEACEKLEQLPQSEFARRQAERIAQQERCMNDPSTEGCDEVLQRPRSEAARRHEERVQQRIELQEYCMEEPSFEGCEALELRR